MNQVSNTDVATADREMEEKANRAKEMLSRRYRGITNEQVRWLYVFLLVLYSLNSNLIRLDSYLLRCSRRNKCLRNSMPYQNVTFELYKSQV